MSLITLRSTDPDEQFFVRHPDRWTHIRVPLKVMARDRQRAVGFVDENEIEFRSLGDHKRDRRRILLYRVPPDNPHWDPDKPQILKVPFLLFADETVEDRDDVLLPVIHEVMTNAARKYGAQ